MICRYNSCEYCEHCCKAIQIQLSITDVYEKVLASPTVFFRVQTIRRR